jgi:hypothetical protein
MVVGIAFLVPSIPAWAGVISAPNATLRGTTAVRSVVAYVKPVASRDGPTGMGKTPTGGHDENGA